ncbi:MAG TPA: radical SAM protein, partial [Burkholderiaceae bacterium]|nr:radical SAM protein [Burkholderiaceae bacterium]
MVHSAALFGDTHLSGESSPALRTNFQPILTSAIRLEACSACQLRCPSCPTTTGHTEEVVGKSALKLADFVKLIDDNPWIGSIELSNYGESFLNPELLGILRHAYERNVTLEFANGANFNHVRDEVLEGLVRYRVANVTCAIDGASQETYKRYRVRGNYDRVIDNIRRVNHFKRALGSELPHLSWQFIAFGHNQHEIPVARALAAELGMRFYVKLSWDTDFSPLVDEDAVRTANEAGVASRTEYLEKFGSDYLGSICMQLWKHPQINWDGKVLGCCRNFWGDFGGNAFRDGLLESLNHEKMAYARDMLEGKKPARPDIPCTTCELYTRRERDKQWFKAPPRLEVSERS